MFQSPCFDVRCRVFQDCSSCACVLEFTVCRIFVARLLCMLTIINVYMIRAARALQLDVYNRLLGFCVYNRYVRTNNDCWI